MIGETFSFSFNLNDAVTLMNDNTGSTTNWYDAAGRLWGIDCPPGASVCYQLDLLNQHDAASRVLTNVLSPLVADDIRDFVENRFKTK